MALLETSFYSDVLGMCCRMNVILPQRTVSQIGMRGVDGGSENPVLYLLHGLSDDHSIWLRRTSIERYASEMGLAVVMPNVHRSFYTDMEQGQRYWTFISEELPRITKTLFKISDKREHTFVAGLSMGGYGALKLALNHPNRYAYAASLSGVMDIAHFWKQRGGNNAEYKMIFGSLKKLKNSLNDLHYVAEELAKKRRKPKLYIACGSEDHLIGDNRRFHEKLDDLKIKHEYVEEPGAHEWGFWDSHIQKVLGDIQEMIR